MSTKCIFIIQESLLDQAALLADQDSGCHIGWRGLVARAIRNMADLGVKQAKDGSAKKLDPAKQLAETHQTPREFVVEVLARMNLHTRDRRQLYYDPASGKAPLPWLPSTSSWVQPRMVQQ